MPHFASFVEFADGRKQMLGSSSSLDKEVGRAKSALDMANAFEVFVVTDGADEPIRKFTQRA